MHAMRILNTFIARQGWDDDSQIHLLCRFIDACGDHCLSRLEKFLQEQADFENGQSEETKE